MSRSGNRKLRDQMRRTKPQVTVTKGETHKHELYILPDFPNLASCVGTADCRQTWRKDELGHWKKCSYQRFEREVKRHDLPSF